MTESCNMCDFYQDQIWDLQAQLFEKDCIINELQGLLRETEYVIEKLEDEIADLYAEENI